jgi:hypothetical protein
MFIDRIVKGRETIQRGASMFASGLKSKVSYRSSPQRAHPGIAPDMSNIGLQVSCETLRLGLWQRAMILAASRDQVIDPFAADDSGMLLLCGLTVHNVRRREDVRGPVMRRIFLFDSAMADTRRLGARGLFRLALVVLRGATTLYQRNLISRSWLYRALSGVTFLERSAATLFFGGNHHPKRDGSRTSAKD